MSEPREDLELATDVARDVRSFLQTLELVASGAAGSQAVALLLLDVAQMCVAGANLGARTDVILDSNVEPLLDPAPDLDKVRDGLLRELEPIDAYAEVFDPYADDPPVPYRLSDDLADMANDLVRGLLHYDAGRGREALWWWQFTYLNSWGGSAGAALRALQSVVAHVRLDAVEEPLPEEDLVGLDANHVLPTANWPGGTFASYHAYPYYPDFLRHEPALQTYGYNNRSDPYAGYLAALRDHHAPHMPTMVTEFGVPSSLGSAHDGPLGRSQGDHSEQVAMATDAELLEMMRRTGIAGGMVFSWTDEWFKTTWNTATHHHPADRRRLWHDPLTNEQYFGVIAADATGSQNTGALAADPPLRSVRTRVDEAYVHVEVLTDGLDELAGRPLTIVVDTVAGGLAPPPPATGKPTGDYALIVDIGQRSAQMLLRSVLNPVQLDQQPSPARRQRASRGGSRTGS